jgi:hypothetical protein
MQPGAARQEGWVVIVYHGTTLRRAQRIALEGFQPSRPSRRVWFAEGRGYARGRADTQARRGHDRPIVLTCDIDLELFRKRLGSRRVFHRNRVIAIHGRVPVTVLPPHLGVQPGHDGIQQLVRWAERRLAAGRRPGIIQKELLIRAQQLLPEFFRGVKIFRKRPLAHLPGFAPDRLAERGRPDPREALALTRLESDDPKQRIRGLETLAEIQDPDLFEWCAMFLEDAELQVRLAALRTMLRCRQVDCELLAPLAQSDDRRIRAAAIAALAAQAGDQAEQWCERGLKDPEPCVRLAAARLLKSLDPRRHRRLFELARHDSHPEIEKLAKTLASRKARRRLRGHGC